MVFFKIFKIFKLKLTMSIFRLKVNHSQKIIVEISKFSFFQKFQEYSILLTFFNFSILFHFFNILIFQIFKNSKEKFRISLFKNFTISKHHSDFKVFHCLPECINFFPRHFFSFDVTLVFNFLSFFRYRCIISKSTISNFLVSRWLSRQKL